jgi:hypothetical protein
MGMITGPCSGNVLVLDLDTHKHPEAQQWWNDLIEAENHGIDPETVEQVTGGGGRQKLFRAPSGYRVPTNRTGIGVDIRGQAGFAVLPPTRHASGNVYDWVSMHGPWEMQIADAQQWLLDAIEVLVGEHGGHQGDSTKTATPETDFDAFGNVQDGREHLMRGCVWRAVLELYRDSPIVPTLSQQVRHITAAYEDYERRVTSRIPGTDKRTGLEQEGRGITAFEGKWRATMRHWGSSKMKVEAARPNPKQDRQEAPDLEKDFAKAEEKAKESGDTFERLDVPQIKNLPDPKWLVSDLIIEQALGFIYGPPGCLKTFIALDLALTFATSKPQWWGRSVERGGAVLYISSEGLGDLKFRIKAWELHRKTVADTSPFRLIRQGINFMRQEDVGKLLNTVQAIADETKASIAAVFVDTVSRVLPGSDENLQKDMTVFIAACDAVRQRFGATVVGIHHTSRAGNMRGSTVIPAAGDFVVEVRREPGAAVGSIFAAKVKAGEDGWEQQFKTVKVQLGDIGGHASLVIDADVGGEAAAAEPGGGTGWPDKGTLRQILAAISEQWFKKQPWCFSKNSPRSASTNIMKRWRIKRKIVDDILAEWTANDVIAHETCDPKNHIVGYRKLTDI